MYCLQGSPSSRSQSKQGCWKNSNTFKFKVTQISINTSTTIYKCNSNLMTKTNSLPPSFALTQQILIEVRLLLLCLWFKYIFTFVCDEILGQFKSHNNLNNVFVHDFFLIWNQSYVDNWGVNRGRFGCWHWWQVEGDMWHVTCDLRHIFFNKKF